MEHPGFFTNAGPFTLAKLAEVTGSEVADATLKDRLVSDIRPLSDARPEHLSFVDNRKYLPQLETTVAGGCFVAPQFASRVPKTTAALVTKQPYRAFAIALATFYPDAGHPKVAVASTDFVSPAAVIEEDVVIEPGAVVGPEARIGRGTRIAANAVVGYRCTIGRGCFIGPNTSVTHALLGDRVILHAGVRIGQDGFGFAMGPMGHLKVPQIGRVIIQDDVEIGANTSIDRGALKDTIIGEGTKIDNLVQIGHNVVIGRHCVIVGQVGISGSSELGDFVVVGGQAGIVGHIKVGTGAQLAGASHAKDDVPAGAVMAGTPARPFKVWAREVAALNNLATARHRSHSSSDESDAS